MGKPGSIPSSPRRRRGVGRVARRVSVARGGEVQRGWEWDQGIAEVPRVVVGKQELACGTPQRRAAPLCAGGRGSREGERWKKRAGLFCNF